MYIVICILNIAIISSVNILDSAIIRLYDKQFFLLFTNKICVLHILLKLLYLCSCVSEPPVNYILYTFVCALFR